MSRPSFVIWFEVLFVTMFTGWPTKGEYASGVEPQDTQPPNRRPPYCGLFCVYAASRICGQELEFGDLLTPEYIGPGPGSSMAQLKAAVEAYGMHAAIMRNLTNKVLRDCPYPVILHVKPWASAGRYVHYELFLGVENGKARILDPPGPVKLVPFYDLSLSWDGNGIIVSAEPIPRGVLFASHQERCALYIGTVILGVLLLRWVRRWVPSYLFSSWQCRFGISAAQGLAIGVVTLTFAFVYHLFHDEGLLANPEPTKVVQEIHAGDFIPKVGLSGVKGLLKRGAIFVDARYKWDFEAGHMEGAINVPVDANSIRRQAIMTSVSKSAQIVVYCQSAGCKYAKKVAASLERDGFSNIVIFKGGWNEWASGKRPQGKEGNL